MTDNQANPLKYNAIFCVTGDTNLTLLHILKQGFRHCFALVEDQKPATQDEVNLHKSQPSHQSLQGQSNMVLPPKGWIHCEALVLNMEVQSISNKHLCPYLIELINQGYNLFPFRRIQPIAPRGLWQRLYCQSLALCKIYSCVIVASQLLGLYSPQYNTPYKLYKKIKSSWMIYNE